MSLSSIQLDAFKEVAKHLSFSKAAQALSITQSALSQRVKNLELDLEVTLFIRDSSGIKLTEAGQKLLRYCQIKNSLEDDFLSELRSNAKNEIAGIIRIASYSSVLRSIIIPAISPFLRANPKVQCEFLKAEMHELPDMLKSGRADLIILDHTLNRSDIIEEKLGKEEYIVIESSKYPTRADIYLDHGPDDNATELYFQHQIKKPKSYKRIFMGDVYGILDGVSQGLGRAVMSKHLVSDQLPVRILKGHNKYTRDVTLHYYRQPFYPKLFNRVREELVKHCPDFL